MSLVANIEARNTVTVLWSGESPRVVMTAAQAAEAQFGWVYKQPGMPTRNDCVAVCDRVQERFGQGEVVSLLQRFGVARLRDLWIGSYTEFVDFGNATVKRGHPPSASWDGLTPIIVTEEEEL